MRQDVLSVFQQFAYPRAQSLLQSLTNFNAEKDHPRNYIRALLTAYDQGAVDVLKKRKNISAQTRACAIALEETRRAIHTLHDGEGEAFLTAFKKIVEQKKETDSPFINGAIGVLIRLRAPDGRCYAAEQALALKVLGDYHAEEGNKHDTDCPEFSGNRQRASDLYFDTAALIGNIQERGLAPAKHQMPHHE